MSEIQRGICYLYVWRQNLGLQQEFRRQILGPSPPPPPPPPRCPNMEVPPWEATFASLQLNRLYNLKLHVFNNFLRKNERTTLTQRAFIILSFTYIDDAQHMT